MRGEARDAPQLCFRQGDDRSCLGAIALQIGLELLDAVD
jgi:hypothetical protein